MNMKRIFWILAALGAGLLGACSEDSTEDAAKPGIDLSDFTIGPDGGTREFNLSGRGAWSAYTDDEWILITPTNGSASTRCTIRVDSTFLSTERSGNVNFSIDGDPFVLHVSQEGYPLQITAQDLDGASTVDLPDYGKFGTTYFDLDVTANLPFRVVIEDPDGGTETPDWLSVGEFTQDLTYKNRPRTTRVRINWTNNIVTEAKRARLRFEPTEAVEARGSEVLVSQAAAPTITPDRRGDSIALVCIARDLGMYWPFPEDKPMTEWDDVTLWTARDAEDEDFAPEKIGRVKSVTFSFFKTDQSLPYEVRYLTAAQRIEFFSNGNNVYKFIEMGDEIAPLAGNLRELHFTAYGFSTINECLKDFKKLRSLSFTGNTMSTIPDWLNQENLPELRNLAFIENRHEQVMDLSNADLTQVGLHGEFATVCRNLLLWSNLETLALSHNYFEGEIPAFDEAGIPKYGDDPADAEILKEHPELEGTPKILPNATQFSVNGNRLSGTLPEWLLKHPNLMSWDPYTYVFSQEGKDSDGRICIFDNVPY